LNLCRHILLVDEDGYRRRDHAFLLRIGGFDVQTVITPLEALNWLSISRAACHPCDLILMVGFLGLHDDHQVFEAVKEASAMVPVLIVDRDPLTGKQIVWQKPSGEQPSISYHQRPQMISDIVRSFFGGREQKW
jgi:hypothetical protein